MNIKMATNSWLSTIESKEQTKQTSKIWQNHRYGDHLEGYQLGGRRGQMGGTVQIKYIFLKMLQRKSTGFPSKRQRACL